MAMAIAMGMAIVVFVNENFVNDFSADDFSLTKKPLTSDNLISNNVKIAPDLEKSSLIEMMLASARMSNTARIIT